MKHDNRRHIKKTAQPADIRSATRLDIEKAAHAADILGQKLVGNIDHVVAVSLRYTDQSCSDAKLYVYIEIEDESVRADVIREVLQLEDQIGDWPVEIELIGAPQFGVR